MEDTDKPRLEGQTREKAQALEAEFLRVGTVFRKQSRGDMEPSAAQALVLIALHPGRTVTELAPLLHITHTGMHYALRTLSEAGLVASAKSNEDRRRVEYVATRDGLLQATRFARAAEKLRSGSRLTSED